MTSLRQVAARRQESLPANALRSILKRRCDALLRFRQEQAPHCLIKRQKRLVVQAAERLARTVSWAKLLAMMDREPPKRIGA